MKIFKTDGLLSVDAEQMDYLKGLPAQLIDRPLLTEDAIINEAGDADALMVLREPITSRVIASLPKLKVIGRFGVGLDTIDIDAATRAGVKVTYVPDSNLDEVSTHAVSLMLALSRKLKIFDRAVRQGRWSAMEDGLGIVRPSAQVLGLVGFGKIGQLTAAKARVFGFNIIAYDPYLSADKISDAGAKATTLKNLLDVSDIVSLHIPLTPETRNILSANAFRQMKRGAIVINVSRGGLIDEQALADSIKSGQIGGAGIDTFEVEPPEIANPLFALEQVLVSPHAAHYSKESFAEVRNKVFRDVALVLGGHSPVYPVNFI